MVWQHSAGGGSLNKLGCPRIAAETTSVDTDIQFSWLSHYMHIGNMCYHASRGCTCLAWRHSTGGCCVKAVVLSPGSVPPNPLSGLGFPLLVDEIFSSLSEFLPCGLMWANIPKFLVVYTFFHPVVLLAAPGSLLRKDLSPLHTSFPLQWPTISWQKTLAFFATINFCSTNQLWQ